MKQVGIWDHESGAKIIGYKENLTCDNSNYRQEDLQFGTVKMHMK